MPVEPLKVTLLCTGAFLAGAGTTLALVGAFVLPSGTAPSDHLTVAALPVVTLGLAFLLGAVVLERVRTRRASPTGRACAETDARHSPDRPR